MAMLAASILILVSLSLPLAQADEGVSADTLLSEEVIKSLLLMHYAKENPVLNPLDHLVFGDVDGDERNDAVLTYQRTRAVGAEVEITQRIVVFIYDYDERRFVIRYDAEVGSSATRMLTPLAIEGGLVKFQAITCSPLVISKCSAPEVTETQFHWTSGELVEL